MRPIWRFLTAAVATWLILFLIAPVIAFVFGRRDYFIYDAIYRPLSALLLLAIYSFLARVADHSSAPLFYMGLGIAPKGIKDFFSGFAFGTALIVIAVLAIGKIGTYDMQPRPGPIIWTAVILQFWILLTGAVAEELAFRGYPFQRLVEAATAVGAIVLTSVLFGLIHIQNPHFSWIALVNTIAVGILFSWVFLRTRSLWLVWGIHFGWNFALGTLFGLPVSGLDQFSVLVRGTATGPTWLTGGDYGIEASVTGFAVICLGLAAVPLIFENANQRIPIRSESASNVSSDATCNSSPSGES